MRNWGQSFVGASRAPRGRRRLVPPPYHRAVDECKFHLAIASRESRHSELSFELLLGSASVHLQHIA